MTPENVLVRTILFIPVQSTPFRVSAAVSRLFRPEGDGKLEYHFYVKWLIIITEIGYHFLRIEHAATIAHRASPPLVERVRRRRPLRGVANYDLATCAADHIKRLFDEGGQGWLVDVRCRLLLNQFNGGPVTVRARQF